MTNKINFIFNPSSTSLCELTSYKGTKLTPTIKQIYTYLLGFHINSTKTDAKGGPLICPCNATIAKKNGLGATAARAAIKVLEEAGIISSVMDEFCNKSYTIEVTPDMLDIELARQNAGIKEEKEEAKAEAVVEEEAAPVTTEESVQAAEEFIASVEPAATAKEPASLVQEVLASTAEEFLAQMATKEVKSEPMTAEAFLAQYSK